ncbi:MAG: hypothetical protein FWG66_11450 [Spirochaetes bacterium]|nr:hypothetical protein [Spirochaetota bacterium]
MAKKKIQLAVLAVVLAFGMAFTGCRGEQDDGRPATGVLADFGLTTANYNSIVSVGGHFDGWGSSDYELALMWSESTQANFHATLNVVNGTGNGNGTAQELVWGDILFSQTERWELVWERAGGEDVGILTFRIIRVPE